jgi:segregation and condensation protein B
MMTVNQLEAALEALLFTMGDSIDIQSIARAIDQDVPTTRKLLEGLRIRYKEENRGIMLLELEDSWQLCTKKEYYPVLIRLASQPRKAVLTDVMLETLSIIAYKQPVTKADIEKIRGVKSDHAVNRLIEYELVTEVGRLDAPGRPILFGTTEEFLRKFGVSSLNELPEINPVKLEDFKAEAEAEIFKNGETAAV